MWQKALSQIQRIKEEGSFVRNVSITSTWNTFGILTQFILSPIITRLYTPDQYGIFTVFNTIVLNVALISSFRYSEAIAITESRQQRNNTILLAFVFVLSITLLSAILVFLLDDQIRIFMGAPWLGNFIYAIPLSIMLSGVVEILVMTNVWRRNFFSNGLAGFLVNITSRSFTILNGLFSQPNVLGLMGGDLTGKIAGALTILLSFVKDFKTKLERFYHSVSIQGMSSVAKLYKHFPIFNLPTNILSSFSAHLPILFFQAQFTSAVVGSYALGGSLLEIVNRLIPYSIASVFLRKAMELKQTSVKSLAEGTYKLYWIIFSLSVIIFIGFALLSRIVFPWIFGPSWEIAGLYASILSVQYAFQFIAVALSEVYKVIEKQRFLLTTTFVSLMLKIGIIASVIFFNVNEVNALLWFCIGGALGSIFQIVGIFINFRFKIWKVSLSLFLLMFALITIIYIVNF